MRVEVSGLHSRLANTPCGRNRPVVIRAPRSRLSWSRHNDLLRYISPMTAGYADRFGAPPDLARITDIVGILPGKPRESNRCFSRRIGWRTRRCNRLLG